MIRKLACLVTGILLLSIARGQQPSSGPNNTSIYDHFTAEEIPLAEEDTIKYSTPLVFCQGGSVVLTANSAPSGASFQWKKNNVNIPGATSVSYTANASGNYSVVVTDDGDSETYDAVTVTVHPYPVAGFTASPSTQCSNIPVHFTNTSTGSGISYSWNFDDPNSGSSNTSTTANPNHTFVGVTGNNNQNFDVRLIANIGGCRDTVTAVVTTKKLPGTQLGGSGFTTYNGLPYFTQCASVTSNFTFTNQSSTAASNTNYVIKWGDNTADFTSTDNWAPITHTYNVGTYTLQYIVTGGNGCKDTATYFVFVGNNPAVGLNNPGNTFICSGTSLTFPLSGTTNNPPGTIYTMTFNDGTSPTTYNHPAPASVTHVFDEGSCGITSGNFPNSFQAEIKASNPCGTSAASVVPIYVSKKGVAAFAIDPNDTVCVNNIVTLTNTSNTGYGVSSSGVCTPGKGIWTITPATGWSISSGSLGNDFGLTDPSVWQNGSQVLNVVFSTPGVYSIRLKTAGSELCGPDEQTRTICVNPAPVANFNLSAATGCGPLAVTTTNTSNTPSCGANTYQWSVSYANTSGCSPGVSDFSYTNGTNANSVNPQFLFTNPGVYTISLVTRSPGGTCLSASVSKTVTVKAKPSATITAPAAVCQNGSINPSATVNNCFSTTAATYAWSFPGGLPASANTSDPGTILYSNAGTFTISLTVTNECGSTTVTKQLTVNPAPDVSVPANLVVCAGTSTGALNFTSSVAGASFSWTNTNTSIGLAASGNGNIPSFAGVNNGNTAQTATITVVPVSGCSGPSQSFTINVNPRPAAPSISSPVTYCLNETASQLSATASGANTLTWYNNAALNNGSPTAPLPSTNVAGTAIYYVTQSNSFNCPSPASSISVTVHPAISGNIIGSDQGICAGGTPNALASTGTVSGGSGAYNYQWQQSADDGTTWTNIAGGTASSFSPGSLTNGVKYRRVVVSSSCADTSNIVTITVQGTLTNIDIAAPQTICAGSAPALLTGQTPAGGSGSFTYQWERSNDNSSWTLIASATSASYQPPVLNATTYFRRQTSSGSCSAYSSSVMITVNQKPVMSTITDKFYCNSSSVNDISFSASPAAGVSYAWTNSNTGIGLAASGNGALPSFVASNTSDPKIPVTSNISVVPTFTSNGVGCAGDAANFVITVLPKIGLNAIASQVVCTGHTIPSFTPAHDAGNFAGSSVSFEWTVTGSGISLVNGSGTNIPSFTTTNAGSTDLIATITVTPKYHFNNLSCNGDPVSYTITVKPGVPQAFAGDDVILCAAASYTMQANQPATAGGNWTQIGTSTATIVDATAATTQVTNLLPGNTYQFVWTLSGFASCPPTKDTVVIRVDAEVINTINTTQQTICAGQSVSINGDVPTGGNGVYQYQWQQSSDNVNWSNIAGQTDPSITFSPAQTVFVRRLVTSLPCFKESASVQVIVQPALTNNTISQDQTICINTVPSTIIGGVPSGGNGIYLYQWQMSTNGGASWADIAGATAQDYSPGSLSVQTKYRRLVSTALCSGPQASTSNVVTVTVNPNARAVFNPTDSVGCIPFTISSSLIGLEPFPLQNGVYAWYVNDVFIGNGEVFPGHTMTQADDSINIKLVAISAFGCLNDSTSHNFYTHKIPQPSFTISDTVGCGPLTVQLNNTTPEIDAFTYAWDFGNGQSSTLAQPGSVTLLPNPTFGDTTYIIKLSVMSACQTLTFTESVRVKSKPKALFTPNNSVGCSPMTVTFNNTSAGIGNSYTWNFGDGSTPVSTTATGNISHTFYTGIQDTFYVKLVAVNECGSDSLTYAIVVSPNQIHLDYAVNGNQFSGCSPHTVQFINNSSGANLFTWNFGDNNIISTTENIDTVSHTYLSPGTYIVTLLATNGCSDTTSTETIIVYPKPQSSFAVNNSSVCIGDTIQFTNQSQGATSYLWQFGDGQTSTLTHPSHHYTSPGLYTVKLITYSFNAPGTVCVDSTEQQVQVVTHLQGLFTVSDSVGYCAPFTVTFTNHNLPSVTATWDFGDGQSGSGNVVSHTYLQAGIYVATLTVTVPGGCTYTTTKEIKVLGPSGSWTHTTGYLCNNNAALFQVMANNTDSLLFYFGDGTSLATTNNIAHHSYQNPGTYFPRVILKNNAGCLVELPGIDSIRVDRIKAGFTATQQKHCGYTLVNFSDTSFAFFGKNNYQWNFGDGNTASGSQVSHNYEATGTYPVQLIVTGNSGCSDTTTIPVTVIVNNTPAAVIVSDTVVCVGYSVSFVSSIQSTDAINVIQWNISNGVSNANASFSYTFALPGEYNVRLVVGTVNGCYDTVFQNIRVNPTPTVIASNDMILCRGNMAPMTATGFDVIQYSWSPLQGLSCYDCPNPIASPLVTTPYIVQGTNSFGCADYDTVVVTVIQPMHLTVSPADSICIGESTNLLASGGTSYSWSPASGLNNTTISNPTASPTVTTTYRVVGYDGYNCFTDTAFVTVAVGQYPVIGLGPDLVLATGTQHPLTSVVQNGPITKWVWTPSVDLACSTCPLPVANIKKDIVYQVLATTAYGCSATDTISIKTFCEKAQVFIPNAFTPNGDGHNDILMVRASGIAMVKSFRVFNRWGEVVFEKANCAPNDPLQGWNGKIKGVVGGPDVFVYTAEVICENGSSYTYKGNVSILK